MVQAEDLRVNVLTEQRLPSLEEIYEQILGLGAIQDWTNLFLAQEIHNDMHRRFDILNCQVGDLQKHLRYRDAYGLVRWEPLEVEESIGAILAQTLVLACAVKVDCAQALLKQLEKLRAQEWKKKFDRPK